MIQELERVLREQPVLVFFLTIGVGCLLGKAEWRGYRVGSAAGVLVAGLVIGHFGFAPPLYTQSIGFMLFIYAVGYQAGPRFFSVLRQDGLRYIALALVTGAVGLLIAKLLAAAFGFEYGVAAGLFAGSLTSTPTLAAAQDAVAALGSFPDGLSAAAVSGNITVAYAITYLFGTVGLIVALRLLPGLLGLDLPREAAALSEKLGLTGKEQGWDDWLLNLGTIRACEVTNGDVVGRTLMELARSEPDLRVFRVKREGKMIDASSTPECPADTRLEAGDHLAVAVRVDRIARIAEVFGPETHDPDLLRGRIDSCTVIASHERAVGRTLAELRERVNRRECGIRRVRRSRVELPLADDLVIQKNDLVDMVGIADQLRDAAAEIGIIEKDVEETDLITFAFGIAFGLVLALLSVRVGGIDIGLGTAGGLLLSGILIGHMRVRSRTFGGLPGPARWLLSELGLAFFMASVGLAAGKGVVATLVSMGPLLLVCGVVVTLATLLAAYAFGRYVLRLNPAILLGAVTGAMTSTPALGAVTDAARSPVPALGYAGTYAFANVVMTVAGVLVMRA